MLNAVRIRTQIESTTLTAPELARFIGRHVEIIVMEDEAPGQSLLATHGMFAIQADILGDPVADALIEMRRERARLMDREADDIAR